MTYNKPAPRAAVRCFPATILAAAVVLSVTLIGVLADQALASTSSSMAPSITVHHGHRDKGPATPARTAPMNADPASDGQRSFEVGLADGVVPDAVTVFDDELPAVANLDSTLLGALREAATDAADDGVAFVVNSGWRSPKHQEQLLVEAVSEYGSEEEAARWVATPTTSAHVSGDAVDIGPADATAWLSTRGAVYGLCQIYDNEPWHFELRADAGDEGCPPLYADPTADPRMQK